MLLMDPEGNYPKSIEDVRALDENWFPGSHPLPEGWREVKLTSPKPTADQMPVEGKPEERDGVLYQTWTYRDMTDEEKLEEEAPYSVRQKLKDLGLNEYEIRIIAGRLL